MKRTSLILLFICSALFGIAQDYKLHPVYIYSFTKYVIWPDASKAGDFEIAVLGDSPIIKELNTMASLKKTYDNRTIKVRKIESVAEIGNSHVLFVPAAKSKNLTDILNKVGAQSVLVITEEAGLAQKGSSINFVIKDGKLAFELNQSTLAKQNLKAANELTRLAIII
ncbi:MAG: YfiR family protein [Cyclobacteriaceae bacterium]|jgi:hypothetical protein|nr:YfiR family protein [Cyclobacteriaceae bacterium]